MLPASRQRAIGIAAATLLAGLAGGVCAEERPDPLNNALYQDVFDLVETVRRGLDAAEAGEVDDAARALGWIGDTRATVVLRRALSSPGGRLRAAAAEAVGRLARSGRPDPEAVPALIALLESKSDDVRSAAAFALGRIGDRRALDPLLKAARDRDELVCARALEALGLLGDGKALDALVKATGDRRVRVRSAAVEALGRIDGQRSVEALVLLMDSDKHDCRKAAVRALGERGALRPLIDRVLNRHSVWKAAAESLEKIGGPKVLDAMAEAARLDQGDVSNWGASGLAASEADRAVDLMVESLGGHPSAREVLVEALSRRAQRKHLLVLAKLAKGGSGEDARRAAVKVLGKRRFAPAAAMLVGLALRAEEDELAWTAAEALGAIGDKTLAPKFIEPLQDEDEVLRRRAAFALGHLGADDGLEPLTAFLARSPDDEDRLVAAEALARLNRPEVLDSLLALLRNEDSGVRERAAVALGLLGKAKAMPALAERVTEDGTASVRQASAEALSVVARGAEDPGAAVKPLTAALSDEDPGVRDAAVAALSRVAADTAFARKAAEALVESLSLRKSDAMVPALSALGEVAVEALRPHLKKGDDRAFWAAVSVCRRVGTPTAYRALVGAADKVPGWRRGEFIEALREGAATTTKALIPQLVDTDMERATRARGLLIGMGERAALRLGEAIRNGGEGLRAAAVDVIMRMESPGVEVLIELLGEEDTNARILAAKTLMRMHDARAVDPLAAAARDRAPQLRAAAVTALGWFADKRVPPVLLAALRDDDADVVLAAVDALGKVGGAKAVKPLLGMLETPEPDLRSSVIQALGRLGDARAVVPLAELREKSNWMEAVDILRALGRIDVPAAADALGAALNSPDEIISRAAMEGLAEHPHGTGRLLAGLGSASKDIRAGTAELLGAVGDEQAVEPLERAAAKEEDASVRKQMRQAVKSIRSRLRKR